MKKLPPPLAMLRAANMRQVSAARATPAVSASTMRRRLNMPMNILPASEESLSMPHLLGIDIGTSGTKTLICDEDGKVLATATAEHPISSPKPGWSEQNPRDWWDSTCKATKAVLKKAKVKAADVSGIGLSGQMHGS